MKKGIIKTAVALTLVLAMGVGTMAQSVFASPVAPSTTPAVSMAAVTPLDAGSITVQGTGVIMAEPDIVTIQIGVQVDRENVGDAVSEATEIIDKIIEAVKGHGVEERDIQSSSYSLWPQFDWNAQFASRVITGPVLIGFQVTHMLHITVRDIDSIGQILVDTVDAGANQIHGINFDVSNRNELYLEALALALEEAQKKAEVLAEAMGVEISTPASVFESQNFFFSPFGGGMGGGSFLMAAAEDARVMAPNVQGGQVGVSAQVSVTYVFPR